MRSPFNYIIKTNRRYNNTVDVDGRQIIVNTEITERDAKFVNRIGTIVSNPISGTSNINIGEEVIVHHNVFRRWIDGKQKERNSANYLGEDTYVVYQDQIFAYKRNGEWSACEGFCFVEPRENEETWLNGHEALLTGYMVYPDKNLLNQGVDKGTLVGFTPNSEYEFNIDGKKLYRIFSNSINISYGDKEDAKKETIGS